MKNGSKILIQLIFDELDLVLPHCNEDNFDSFPVLTFVGKFSVGNVGIGSYEYWGQKCNDVQLGAELDEITWNSDDFSDEDNAFIESFLESDSYEKNMFSGNYETWGYVIQNRMLENAK